MSFHRHSTVLVAAAVFTYAAVAHGLQPPSRPSAPVRDPANPNTQTRVGTASISGTVTLAPSGQPARRTRVTLSGTDVGPARNATTDEQGRFAFFALPPGRYSLSASRPGHIAGNYGQPKPGRPGTPIQLQDGQKFEARLQVTRGGVLTGTVLDEAGEALPGTQVRALRFVLQNGQRTLVPSGNGATDDRGVYRIYGLQPGDYLVGATPRNTGGPEPEVIRREIETLRQRVASTARTDEAEARALTAHIATMKAAIAGEPDEQATGYAPIYYPGTVAVAQAAPITVGPGEEHSGVDFQLQRVPVARIEGMVVNSTGQPLQNVQVMLIDTAQAVPGVGNNTTRADNEGRFRFSNVAPGQYRIGARAVAGERGGARGQAQDRAMVAGRPTEPGQSEMRVWGSLDVTVDGRDLTNVMLPLQPGLSVSGRVQFQGTSLQPPADLSRMRVSVAPSSPGPMSDLAAPAQGQVDASGKFTIAGVTPGRYRLSATGGAQGWLIESAMVDGQDSADFPFEVKAGQNVPNAVITFTDQRAELSGTLTDSRAQPATDYTLVLYPADQRYWTPPSRRIRTARPATDGRFNFGNLPPGDYRIAPVVDVEPGAWFDPAFLQQLDAAALRVSIAEGEKKVQNVRISGG